MIRSVALRASNRPPGSKAPGLLTVGSPMGVGGLGLTDATSNRGEGGCCAAPAAVSAQKTAMLSIGRRMGLDSWSERFYAPVARRGYSGLTFSARGPFGP